MSGRGAGWKRQGHPLVVVTQVRGRVPQVHAKGASRAKVHLGGERAGFPNTGAQHRVGTRLSLQLG